MDGWAGAGGLSLGFEAAGFAVTGREMNADAVATYNANLKGISTREIITADTKWPAADVFIGGPPCQPFSFIGEQAGRHDPRDGFPAFFAAVRATKPEVFLCENVPGLLGRNRPYLDHVVRRFRGLGYSVQHRVIDASQHGVPQRRRRLVILGTRKPFEWPEATVVHTTAGAALGSMAKARRTPELYLTAAQDDYIARYEAKSFCTTPRDLRLDAPARTITCRNIGGSTSDMQRLVMRDGKRRRLTVAEAATLQSFPSSFVFKGCVGSQYDQVGNAVPPLVARHLADVVLAALEG